MGDFQFFGGGVEVVFGLVEDVAGLVRGVLSLFSVCSFEF